MFLLKSTTRLLKKVTAVALTAVTAFSAVSLFPETAMQKAEAAITTPKAVPDGVYYIKNVNSGLYMDMYNNGNVNLTRINQYTFHGAMNQRFLVQYHTNSSGASYYTIHPMNVYAQAKAFDLGTEKDARANGTALKIYNHNSNTYVEQRFIINRATKGPGYEIGSWASGGNKVLEVINSSCSVNAFVQTWEKSDDRRNDNWEFIKAPMQMQYDICTDLNESDTDDANAILSRFNSLGYHTIKGYRLSKKTIKMVVEYTSVVMIHGHGTAGKVHLTSSEDLTPGTMPQVFPKEEAQHLQLVYYAACHSADSSNGTSIVDATLGQGVQCVIGFKNNVGGGEDFLLYMMEAISQNKYMTVENAVKKARDKFYSVHCNDSIYKKGGEKEGETVFTDPSSPINPNNLVVKGNKGVILDLRLP